MTTLSDDTQSTTVNEEVEMSCNKPRLEDQTHFIHLKLHTRLIIYEIFDWDWDSDEFEDSFSAIFNNYPYVRMTLFASILGDLEALQYLAGISDNIFIPKNDEGLRNGELLEEGPFPMEFICYLLAINGHWKTLRWAITEQYPHKNPVTLSAAVDGGAEVEMLQWLHSQGCLGNESTFERAAERGDWSIMIWLREINCPWDKTTFVAAADKCSLGIFRWLKSENCPWDTNVFRAVVKRGDVKMLLWLRVHGCPWDMEFLTNALDSGADLTTLEWIVHEDEKLLKDSGAFLAAIKRGDMEILTWVRSQKCVMTCAAFTDAIKENIPLDLLKWMNEDAKCPWDKDTFVAAVKRGDLDILKWMRAKECPWNSTCFLAALEEKRFDIVKWLHEEKCPKCNMTCELLMQEFIHLNEQQQAT